MDHTPRPSPFPPRPSTLDRPPSTLAWLAACIACLLAAGGCESRNVADAAAPPPPAPARRPAPTPSNPLAFTAATLDGSTFDFAEQDADHRVVVYLVDATAPEAALGTRVAQRLHEERQRWNLELVGVVVPPGYRPLAARRVPDRRPPAPELAALARKHLADEKATFPCVVDPDAAIVERYTNGWGRARLSGLPAFYAFPVEARTIAGYPVLARQAARSAEPAGYLHRRVLKQFGIEAAADVDPLAGDFPEAPDAALTDSAGRVHRLRDFRGRLVILVFVSSDCPRCKAELALLSAMLGTYGPAARKQQPWLEVLAVCTDAQGDALKQFVADHGYTFPVAADADWAIRSAFRYRGATPDTFVVDPQGRIRFRHYGFVDGLRPVLQMEIATLLGETIRPILSPNAYSGDEACRICHAREFADWSLTRHACAWETLVRMGREDDPKCVRCHVVDAGAPGGFTSARETPELTSVQCESCHGRNGCSAFTGRPVEAVKAAACTPCHDAFHSPRFDFAAYRPRILHDRADELARLPRAEREARLKRLCSAPGQELFPPDVPCVGDAACGKCHPTELAALKGGPHARALEPLARPAPDGPTVPQPVRGVVGIGKPECVRCHVTGFGRPGGFPAAVPPRPLEHPLAGVGCEACHGPGKAHADDPKKPRAIARLGGTCPECNVLPVCRQCHDEANSPRFDYRTALPKARHPVGKAVSP